VTDWRRDWRKQGGVKPGPLTSHLLARLAEAGGPLRREELEVELAALVPPGMAYRNALRKRAVNRASHQRTNGISDPVGPRFSTDEQTVASGKRLKATDTIVSAQTNGYVKLVTDENGLRWIVPTMKFLQQVREGRTWQKATLSPSDTETVSE
jgi:hypothetical protein